MSMAYIVSLIMIPFDKQMLQGIDPGPLPDYRWSQLTINTWSAETTITWATWL